MKLKEKAEELVGRYYHLFSVELENTIDYTEAKQCALIADDYAIEFLDWVLGWLIDTDNKQVGEFTIKELLEIFKKEKVL